MPQQRRLSKATTVAKLDPLGVRPSASTALRGKKSSARREGSRSSRTGDGRGERKKKRKEGRKEGKEKNE
jgi:hypothetical protein